MTVSANKGACADSARIVGGDGRSEGSVVISFSDANGGFVTGTAFDVQKLTADSSFSVSPRSRPPRR